MFSKTSLLLKNSKYNAQMKIHLNVIILMKVDIFQLFLIPHISGSGTVSSTCLSDKLNNEIYMILFFGRTLLTANVK